MIYVFLAILVFLSIMTCIQESKKRQISLGVALLFSLVFTPIIAYVLIRNKPLRDPRGCNCCSNTQNEAEYCGLCHKNEAGVTRRETSS
ncbi:MAG: multisubunit Na+/H+ antiporter MnhG subunit [Bacteroidia bacterium]|jgi:multisubunit Na+/H+ antiporter MnhG subunit